MQAVGLQDKRDCKANALSGGMKRKLQVALALLGSSKVVLLGEQPSYAVLPFFLVYIYCFIMGTYWSHPSHLKCLMDSLALSNCPTCRAGSQGSESHVDTDWKLWDR